MGCGYKGGGVRVDIKLVVWGVYKGGGVGGIKVVVWDVGIKMMVWDVGIKAVVWAVGIKAARGVANRR